MNWIKEIYVIGEDGCDRFVWLFDKVLVYWCVEIFVVVIVCV